MINPEYICMNCMRDLNSPRSKCSHCGFDNASCKNAANQLECGSILAGTYLVGCALGQGGFGITYIGLDLNLNMKVAIKEYYPEGYVTRDGRTHMTVIALPEERKVLFERGKEKFVNEAQILAKFNEDRFIVGVRGFFNENGTSYIVMNFVEGETLKKYTKLHNGKLSAPEVLVMIEPLLTSLANVHAAGLLHRDISPDNIMWRKDGVLVLIDFGAARQISLTGDHSNTINVKHGFAPEEQYRTHGKQGPWTDIYALCATIYYVTTGIIPQQALDRIASRTPLAPPTQLGAKFTRRQEKAIMKGLSVRASQRQQTIGELRAELYDSENSFEQEREERGELDSAHEHDSSIIKGKKSQHHIDKKALIKNLLILLPIIVIMTVITIILFRLLNTTEVSAGANEDADTMDVIITSKASDSSMQMYTASISEYTDPTTSQVFFDIDIYAPTNSTIRIVTDSTFDKNIATVPSNDHVILRVPRDAFMPNQPVDSEVVTITPNIQVISPEGETKQLTVPDITVTVPVLSMNVTEPAADTVNATAKNDPIAIIGRVTNYDKDIFVFVNGEQIYVDTTGMFTSSYTPKAPDASASGETITIEARKNNCVTARKVITVVPYVKQNLSFMVTNELASLSSADGTVTIIGTVTPGAKVTATSASTDVSFAEATVTDTGTFSLIVSIAKIGAFDVNLAAQLQGYYDGTASVIVERPPSDYSTTFKKACSDLSSSYQEIVAGTVTSGNFVFTGKVTEIIATDPYTIFRMQISEGLEVIVVNRSAKSIINSADLGESKQIGGTLKGMYSDGVTPFVWCWFVWNQ